MDLEHRVDRLEDALTRLAEAQARADARMEELAQAQARAEERGDRLETALTRLAQAQARTEVRLEELAQAQARTETRVEELAQAQQALAQAQARTEVALQGLAQQVGRLAETIGFTLEDLAREVAPPYLAQHYGIRVDQLERRFFQSDGQEVEVDLYGEGRRDGEPVTMIGEVKSRIYGRDVEGASRQADRLVPQLPAPPVVVLFGFVIHPSARAAADRLGAIVISSSGRPQ